MIEREAKTALKRLASQFSAVGITGPRQSGKSTLVRATFPEKKYISFDDQTMRQMAENDPKGFMLAFPDGAIIDEAQKVPAIFDAIKEVIDNRPAPGQFILTGSSQFRLHENMSDSLAGRIAVLKLLPFSLRELSDASFVSDNPFETFFRGCYPPLYDSSRNFNREDWIQAYIDTYIDLDVKDKINPSNLSTFRKFLQVVALYSGQMVSMDSISRRVGVSAPTVKEWLSILETSFIIHFLEPDVNNLGKELVKTPKLYFVDTGLLAFLLRIDSVEELILSPYRGAIVETFVVSELMKKRLNAGKKPNLTYFRDQKGFEVDIIADWQKNFAIEIKSGKRSENNMGDSVKKYLALKGDQDTSGIVLYLGDLDSHVNGIHYIPWQKWSEGIGA